MAHTPFKTFKGGDPINALITIQSYSNFFLLDFIRTKKKERKKERKITMKRTLSIFCLLSLNDYKEKVLSLLVLQLLMNTSTS